MCNGDCSVVDWTLPCSCEWYVTGLPPAMQLWMFWCMPAYCPAIVPLLVNACQLQCSTVCTACLTTVMQRWHFWCLADAMQWWLFLCTPGSCQWWLFFCLPDCCCPKSCCHIDYSTAGPLVARQCWFFFLQMQACLLPCNYSVSLLPAAMQWWLFCYRPVCCPALVIVL